MTPETSSTPTSDDEFLDRAFDQVLEQLEDGLDVAPADLLDGRDHLRPQVEELIRLAEQIAVGPPRSLPVVPGYAILSELGRGGMGAVYLARQEKLGGRPVALKVLPATVALSSQARQRFRSETHAVARLRHPNIVAVHDVVEQADTYAYAMEWVDGKSLAELIDSLASRQRAVAAGPRTGRGSPSGATSRETSQSPPIEPTIDAVSEILSAPDDSISAPTYPIFICRLGIAIARALAAVHRENLLHRDIKPSNILLRRDGTPLLTDFGLARDADSTQLTQTGHFVGTLAYASPEQLRAGGEALDQRSDVYSLGVTLYHTLTLRRPFHGVNTAQILRQIETGRAEPLRRRNPKLSQDLQTIVAKAMDPDPERRYESADALADDLERLLNIEPIKARPVGLLTRTLKLARRNKRAVAGAAVGGSLVLILAVLAGIYLILVPGWVEAHVRSARLTLLDPLQSDRVLGMLYGFARPEAPAFPETDSATKALAAYDAALFWRPFDDDIGIERDIARLARGLSENAVIGSLITHALEKNAPLTCKYARAWADSSHDGPPEIEGQELDIAESTDLRALGLLAFLCSDPQICVAAWEKLDLIRHPDPFVEATLGQLYLMTDRAAEAVAHLIIAMREYPSAGFLRVDLADALIQRGSLDTAGELIDEARESGIEDPHFGLKRVEADYFAARGRDAEAREIYEWFRRKRQNPPARRSYGRFLESHGELREAVQVYQELVKLRPKVAKFHAALLAAADTWWASLPPTERYFLLRRSLDTYPRDPRSFPAMLRTYRKSLAALNRLDGASEQRGTPGIQESRPTRDSFGQETTTLGPTFFSPLIQKVTLIELCQRMEISDMDRWKQMTKYPSFLKDAQVSAWLSGSPRSATKVVSVVSAAWRTLACASVMLFADIGSAQVVFTDGEFLESDWDIPVVIRVGTGGEVSAMRRSSGGNPGAFREVTLTVNGSPKGQDTAFLSFHRRIGAVYQPMLEGPVGAISFHLDRNCIASPGPGCRQVALGACPSNTILVTRTAF